MKIHAFKVSQRGVTALGDVLAHLKSIPIVERMRNISGDDIRLEDASPRNSSWFLDFGGIKHEGPGRASTMDPITDFDLEEHEGFG